MSPREERERKEMHDAIIGCVIILLGFVAVLLIGSLAGGCVSENTGSSTIVGEQMALPQITDGSDSLAINVYESIKGARVWTAKDSKVEIVYANAYTNSYFGIVRTHDAMQLKVKVEPLAVEPPTAPTETK